MILGVLHTQAKLFCLECHVNSLNSWHHIIIMHKSILGKCRIWEFKGPYEWSESPYDWFFSFSVLTTQSFTHILRLSILSTLNHLFLIISFNRHIAIKCISEWFSKCLHCEKIPQFSSVSQSCPILWNPMNCSANSQSLLKLMSIELVMPSNCLILCHPLLLLSSIFPGIFGSFPHSSVVKESTCNAGDPS